jgi:hypothetical protein
LIIPVPISGADGRGSSPFNGNVTTLPPWVIYGGNASLLDGINQTGDVVEGTNRMD